MGLKLILVVAWQWFLHPIHLTVTDVEHDTDRQALEFSTKIFLDDLEFAIRDELGEPFIDITDPGEGRTTEALVRAFVLDRLTVRVNDKEEKIDYLGGEIDGDAMIIYYQILGVKKLKTLEVSNRIFLERFDDQVNMIHLKTDDGLKSIRCTPSHQSDEFSLN